jgi:hypothetical protein
LKGLGRPGFSPGHEQVGEFFMFPVKNARRIRLLAAAAAVSAIFAVPQVATAGVIPLDLFVTGSGFGSTPPTGTVTITDIGSDVRVDFQISDGDLSELFFNLIQPFDFNDLSIRSVSTMPGDPRVRLTNSPQAPSNLDFDFGVDFGRGSSPGNTVRSGSFVLALDGFDLSQPSFYQSSTNPGGTSVAVGAKIQSLGKGGGGSATIGGNPGGSTGGGSTGGTPVPAPAGLGLFALAAVGLLGARRRKAA